MHRTRFVILSLIAALVLLVTAYGSRPAAPATAAPLPADSPLDTPGPTSPISPLQSPLKLPASASALSPLKTPAAPATGPLSPKSLANMTYLSGYGEDGSATLVNGEYSKPVEPGSAARNAVTLLPQHTAYGTLNRDDAAAVILTSSGGGSGTWMNLAVVVEQNGKPVNIAATELGDRVHVNAVAIQGNQILVDMITHDTSDPACCPSLQIIKTYELEDDELVELATDVIGKVEPDLSSREVTPLEGTNWLLVNFRSDGEMVAAVPEANAVISFENRRISGNSGCNSFFGSYSVEDDQITFGDMGATLMACPDDLMLQEQALLNALAESSTFLIAEDALRLYNDYGTIQAMFEVADQATLTGPAWSVTGYNNGRGGFASLIDSTEITAIFGEDGTLSGNAGCNNYTAAYTAAGDSIQIGPVASTRMMCNQPEGVMQQEREYLAALSTAAVYAVNVDSLELRSADGALVATYMIQPSLAEAAGVCATDVLVNVEYTVDAVEEPVQLEDGKYEDAANRIVVELMSDLVACGDVTGDGQDDGVALLWANTGGSGVFTYMAVVSDEYGTATNVATTLLGDRVMVDSLSIDNMQIAVEMITQGPDDAMCCPTQQVVNTYELQDGELAELSSEIVDGLTPVKLANMQYDVEETEYGSAWLVRGIYEEPAAPESSAMTVVMLIPESIAFGEIDGVSSAADVLIVQPGGSGTFYYLELVQEVDGRPVHVGSALLGDRIVLNSVAIQEDQIVVDMVTQGPDDPMCCPSTRVVNTYASQDGSLVELSSEVQERAQEDADTLVGPVWRWVGSQYNDDTDAVPVDPDQYTIQFMDDWTVAVQVDCNSATGTYTADSTTISIDIAATTLAACPEGSLEETFLRDLAGVAIYFFQDGSLYMDIQMDTGTMQFTK